jgi:hypothetical protein
MQLNKVTKTLLTVAVIALVALNAYFLINRFNKIVKYEDEIEYVENNTLSDFETEQNNFEEFVYTPNTNLVSEDFEDKANIIAESLEEIDELRGDSNEIILDSSFIDKLPEISEFEVKSIMLPFKYSDYFDYSIYGESEPQLELNWNFQVLSDSYDYFYLDILYINEFNILPGPLTKLDLVERAIGYLKSKGIDPSRIVLAVDARYFVWGDRYFEDSIILNQTDKELQADVVSKSEFGTKYRELKALSGLTDTLSNTEKYDYIALSLDLDIVKLTNLATNLGLRGIMVRYG